jgi:hypothetical protein
MLTCILYLFTVQDVLVKGLKVSVDSTYNVPANTKDGKVSHVNSKKYIGLLYDGFQDFLGNILWGSSL